MSNSPEAIQIEQTLLIGENDHGYQFCVGLVGDRWCGFAVGQLDGGDQGVWFFPAVAEGFVMGLTDRDAAIRLTGAIASDPESAFGGVTRWYVDEPLRGAPEDFRCQFCGEVGCDGRDCRDFEPEPGGA